MPSLNMIHKKINCDEFFNFFLSTLPAHNLKALSILQEIIENQNDEALSEIIGLKFYLGLSNQLRSNHKSLHCALIKFLNSIFDYDVNILEFYAKIYLVNGKTSPLEEILGENELKCCKGFKIINNIEKNVFSMALKKWNTIFDKRDISQQSEFALLVCKLSCFYEFQNDDFVVSILKDFCERADLSDLFSKHQQHEQENALVRVLSFCLLSEFVDIKSIKINSNIVLEGERELKFSRNIYLLDIILHEYEGFTNLKQITTGFIKNLFESTDQIHLKYIDFTFRKFKSISADQIVKISKEYTEELDTYINDLLFFNDLILNIMLMVKNAALDQSQIEILRQITTKFNCKYKSKLLHQLNDMLILKKDDFNIENIQLETMSEVNFENCLELMKKLIRHLVLDSKISESCVNVYSIVFEHLRAQNAADKKFDKIFTKFWIFEPLRFISMNEDQKFRPFFESEVQKFEFIDCNIIFLGAYMRAKNILRSPKDHVEFIRNLFWHIMLLMLHEAYENDVKTSLINIFFVELVKMLSPEDHRTITNPIFNENQVGEIINQYENTSFSDSQFTLLLLYLITWQPQWFTNVLRYHHLAVRCFCFSNLDLNQNSEAQNINNIIMNQKCDKQTKDLLMYYKKQSFFVGNLNSLFCRKVSKILKTCDDNDSSNP